MRSAPRTSRRLPPLAFAGCVAIIAAIIAWRCAAAGEDNPPIEVVECRIKLLDEVVLAADRSGILAELKFRAGDRVKRDDLVARLHDEIAQAAFDSAAHAASSNVQVRYAKKAREVAWVEHQKAVETNKKSAKAVPAVELLKLKLAAEGADLELEKAEHDFHGSELTREEARAQLESHRIRAPFDGVVIQTHKSEGAAVTQGEPIIEIVNPDRLRVEGWVNLEDAWRLKPGAHVTVRLDLPDSTSQLPRPQLEGRLVFVDVSVEPVKRQAVRVWAEVVNREHVFRAGSTASMTIDPSRLVEPARTARSD